MDAPRSVAAASGANLEPRYRPISDYGIIGDCRTAALVGPDGSIDWCCMPHFDSPAVLLRLLDADKGGYFRVRPDSAATTRMEYLPGTNILETTFATDEGRLRLVDFMPIRRRKEQGSKVDQLRLALSQTPHARLAEIERQLGNDVAAAHRINRMVACLAGNVTVELTLKATFDYARATPTIERHVINQHTAGAILSAGERFLVLLVRREQTVATPPDSPQLALDGDDETVTLRVPLHAGQTIVAVVNYARSAAEARTILAELVGHEFNRDLDETLAYWRNWSASCRYHGPYQEAVWRSALALKLCTFEPTGAIVAAPTTSLPESIGGVRNWDYRYTWLRDSSFTLGALQRLGYYGEARDYFHFLHDLQITSGDDVRIMYGIRGESDHLLTERSLDHLEGYRGSRPVRIGNAAATQRQLDIYGELLDSAYRYIFHDGFLRRHSSIRGTRDLRELSCVVADYVVEHWHDRDRGIWEVRGDPRPFVYSRAMCWVALDRAVKMADRHGHQHHVTRWSACQDAIHEDVSAHGYSQALDSFTQAYGSETLDASNLRLPLTEFKAWSNPRTVSTIDATMRMLAAPHALLYRYRTAADADGAQTGNVTDDGLPGPEGTFVACAFWLIDDLCHLGRIDEARERFEEILRLAGPLGLFSEEIDPDTGAHLGNYPQAFTHIGLINSAVNLAEAQEGTFATVTRYPPLQ